MLNEEEVKNPETIGPSRFTFNGNIIAEIGEESISNPYIAITELIKNSYDADAKQVILNLENLGKHNAKMVISDDGCGMDASQIKDKWMDIGSPHKKEIERTEENDRIPVGAKGIGRFAAHCLGKGLKLITASKNERFGYKLDFDWEKYSPAVKATDIDNESQKFKKKISTRGTTLVVENLKHDWNDNHRLREIIRDVYLLTSPIDQPKNFRIKENISKNFSDLKRLDPDFLKRAGYHLKVKLTRRKEIISEFFKDNQKIKEEKKELNSELSCGDVSFDLYFYYKTQNKWKQYFNREPSKKELEEISQMLEAYGGIKLYRDKFRVKPYGDKDADWIGLDKWSRDQSIVPGNTQIIGLVTIGKESNPNIEDTTSREGVINRKEFFDLVKFVTTCIKLFVDFRSTVEGDKVKAKKTKKIKVVPPKVQEAPPAVQETQFIDVHGQFPTNHYTQLISEANECEMRNYPNAAFWLSRKIVENLVYHILEKKYKNEVELWYDTTNRRNHSLSKLIENLYSRKDQFKPNVQEYIEQFKIDVGTFKKAVDAAVHKNYFYLSKREELKQYKVNKIIQLLIQIYDNL